MSIREEDGKRIADAFERIAASLEVMNSYSLTEEEKEMNRLHADVEKHRLEKFIANGYEDPTPKPVDTLTPEEQEMRKLQRESDKKMLQYQKVEQEIWYREVGVHKEKHAEKLKVEYLKKKSNTLPETGILFDMEAGL